MKVLMVGLGSIGLRHAAILQEHFSHELLTLRSGTGEKNTLGIPEVFSWDDAALWQPDVAFIVSQTNMHMEHAFEAAKRGMHLFIEKPLSHSLEHLETLRILCIEKRLTAYVAYCMRFHPVIKALRALLSGKKILHARVVCSSYLPDWRPGRDHLKSYSASGRAGGGVILDLSHEFDYCQYLFGDIDTMTGFCARTHTVTVDAEDVADAVLRTKQGLLVNVHINFMSQLTERTIVVDFDGGYAVADLVEYRLEWVIGKEPHEQAFTNDRTAYLKEQIVYFFDNIGNSAMMNNLQEASLFLEKILQFKAATTRGQ